MLNPTKRSTLVAVFEDRNQAIAAVDELERAGFKHEEIGFAIRGSEAVRGGMITDATGTKDAKGALTGMATGGMVGGVLTAAVSLLIPGVGPIVAGGVLAAFFGGAGSTVVLLNGLCPRRDSPKATVSTGCHSNMHQPSPRIS